MSQDEEVMCVDRSNVPNACMFDIFMHGPEYAKTLMTIDRLMFVPRSLCETDRSLKQLIPYIVLRDDRGRVLCYERPGSGGEGRLHGKLSIGFGGHVNREDGGYAAGFNRELREEISGVYPGVDALESAVGTVNDDTTDVGSVHLGIVHVISALVLSAKPREATRYNWIDPNILTGHPRLESWSQLVLDWMVSK